MDFFWGSTYRRFCKIVFLLSIGFLMACGNSAPEKAYQLYHDGKYEEAQKAYETILAKDPDSAAWNYNLGVVFYKKGDYPGATDHFVKTLASDDPGLEARANFNIGNCKVRLAEKIEKVDLRGAVDLYREALDFYQRATELDERDRDAQVNHQWVEKKLIDLENLLKRQELKARDNRSPARKQEKSFSASDIPPSPGYPRQKEADSQGPEQQNRFKSLFPPSAQGKKGGMIGQKDGNRIEMSKEEAEMLLERYQLEEGPLTSSWTRKGKRVYSEVKKDW